MKFDNFKKRRSEIHRRRFGKFSVMQIPSEKIYRDSLLKPILFLVLIILIFSLFFFFTKYKEFALKSGIFGIFFALYKIYISLTRPILKLNEEGLEVKNIRLLWKDIKKTEINWKGRMLNLEIFLKNGKVIKEQLDNFKFMNYIYLYPFLRAFRKNNRARYIFKKQILID